METISPGFSLFRCASKMTRETNTAVNKLASKPMEQHSFYVVPNFRAFIIPVILILHFKAVALRLMVLQ